MAVNKNHKMRSVFSCIINDILLIHKNIMQLVKLTLKTTVLVYFGSKGV